jgi:hypothetical protein
MFLDEFGLNKTQRSRGIESNPFFFTVLKYNTEEPFSCLKGGFVRKIWLTYENTFQI